MQKMCKTKLNIYFLFYFRIILNLFLNGITCFQSV